MNESTQPQDFSHERSGNVPQELRADLDALDAQGFDTTQLRRILRVCAGAAEPFWMQDVRLAQRRIDDRRAALAADRARSRPADSE